MEARTVGNRPGTSVVAGSFKACHHQPPRGIRPHRRLDLSEVDASGVTPRSFASGVIPRSLVPGFRARGLLCLGSEPRVF